MSQLVVPIRIENFDHLLDKCKRAERNISKWFSYRIALTNPRKVYAIDFEENYEQIIQAEALQKDKIAAKKLICWNCKAAGHSFNEGPVVQRSVFCYRYGFADVTTPTCLRYLGNNKTNTR